MVHRDRRPARPGGQWRGDSLPDQPRWVPLTTPCEGGTLLLHSSGGVQLHISAVVQLYSTAMVECTALEQLKVVRLWQDPLVRL